MNKNEFFSQLRSELHMLSEEEISQTLAYYGEMIDDRCDNGMDEAQAIYSLGSIKEIAASAIEDAKERGKLPASDNHDKSQNKTSSAVLSLLGFIALVLVALYVGVVLWGMDVSFFSSGIGLLISACFISGINGAVGAIMTGIGLILLSLGLFFCIPCIKVTQWFRKTVKNMYSKVKTSF